MNILRDDCDERQIRVDRMVEEFRKAQSRRLAKAITVKADDHVVELQADASGGVAVDPSTTTSTSHSNG
jgi:hypothetical protein